MKKNRLLSVLLTVLMVFCLIPLSANASTVDSYGPARLSSPESLYTYYNLLGIKTDYDVEYRNNTLYINTSKFIQIDIPYGNSQNFRIVFEHNANVAFRDMELFYEGSGAAVTVNSGKTVNLTVYNSTLSSLNGSALTVNGTLNMKISGSLSTESSNGYGIDGSGTLNLTNGTLIAKGTKSGIGVKNFNCDHSVINAAGTAPGAVGIGRSGSVMNYATFDYANLTVTGGEGAAGIGAGAKGTLGGVTISNSLVTVTGGEGAETDIGGFSGGALKSLAIDRYSSVKGEMNVIPKDFSGAQVELHKIENPTSASILIDDYVFPYRNHRGEKAVYAYLAIGEHTVATDAENLYLGDFVIKSKSAKFSPTGLSYDPMTKKLTVSTNEAFSISNKEPSIPTEDHIFISYGTGANITLDEVNICTESNAIRIDDNSPRDVNITLAEGSYNHLISTEQNNCAIKRISKKIWTGFEMAEPGCGTLYIKGNGYLYAEGGKNASAIGCNNFENAKNFTFVSGNIIAVGGENSAALNCQNLTVNSAAQLKCIAGEGASGIVTTTAKNERGTKVYQLSLENCESEDTVYLDGSATEYKPVFSINRKNVSFFTENTEHCVEQGSRKVYYRLNGQVFEEYTPDANYDTGDFLITGGEPVRDYTYSDGVLTVKAADPERAVTISNKDKSTPTTDVIAVPDNRDVYMIFDGVNIDTSSTGKTPLTLKNAEDVYIILAKDSKNSLKGSSAAPTIYKPGSNDVSTLTIRGVGELNVIGNGNRAVGANDKEAFSHFYVQNGTLNLSAIGDSDVIGTGNDGEIKDIVFERADITIEAENGRPFGVGKYASVKDISVLSGVVTFKSKNGSIFRIRDNDAVIENFGIYGGSVTFDTNKYVFSVPSSAAKQIRNFVIAPEATVFTNKTFEKAPVDSEGNEVYACEITNEDTKQIFIDGELYPHMEHNGRKAVYPYLCADSHSMTLGDTEYLLVFDEENKVFVFREMHSHTFEDEWQHNDTHHWHECTVENCWLELPDMLDELTADEQTASGYAEHDYIDFVCECGHEDVAGCREHYKNRIKGFMISDPVSLEIRKNALAELETAASKAEITECFDRCSREIDAVIKGLSSAVSEATDAINNALGEYKTLLTDGHGYDLSEVISVAENGIMCIRTDVSVNMITKDREKILLDLENAALDTARKNTTLTVQLAAATVAVPSDTVDKTVLTAKKAIANADTFEDIFDIEAWALEIIEALGAEVHEHSFSDIYSKNESFHWHAATCEHTFLVADMEAHTFGEGTVNGNTTTYICTVCGYEKTETRPADENEKALAAAKEAAKAAVDSAAGSAPSAETERIVSEAKAAIDSAKTTEEVELAMRNGITAVEKQKQAEQPSEPAEREPCPECGKVHDDNFWGKLVCFFNRIGNFFRKMFGR